MLLAQIASVVALVFAVVEWRLHTARMESERAWPGFVAERITEIEKRMDALDVTDIPIGRFPLAQQREAEAVAEPKPLAKRLAELGQITGSVVSIEDGSDGIRSSITFRRTNGDISTIAVGEALETGPHPDLGPAIRVPVRYEFVGCQVENGAIYFVFDTFCDGTSIERIQWMAQRPAGKSRPAPAPPNDKRDWQTVFEKDIGTRVERDPKTLAPIGVRIVRIRPKSRALRFGFRADDVVIAINDRSVISKADARRIVRDEIDRKKTSVIAVRFIRNGKLLTKRFDARQ